MKKIISILLVAMLIFSFAACGNNASNSNNNDTEVSDDAQNTQDDAAEKTQGKTLVVYYSATGSTKAVAETIAETAGADLFELTPVEPYTSSDLNWNDSSSRVNAEHEDESKRNVPLVSSVPENWDDYDTVFVGYPIWWGIAAWPVNEFIASNDFTGKTVIPFCTSASSGLGQSGELLSEAAGTGSWLEGQRFSSGVSSSDVADWVNGLGL